MYRKLSVVTYRWSLKSCLRSDIVVTSIRQILNLVPFVVSASFWPTWQLLNSEDPCNTIFIIASSEIKSALVCYFEIWHFNTESYVVMFYWTLVIPYRLIWETGSPNLVTFTCIYLLTVQINYIYSLEHWSYNTSECFSISTSAPSIASTAFRAELKLYT